MTWRERRQPGSFRGVPFHFSEVEGTHGRRTAIYEYPLRDKPDTEDLGRKARQFSINAYIIGPDYDQGRDALAEALDAPGVGLFVHPTRGEQSVAEARLSESTANGGMAQFSITFVQSDGGVGQPSVGRDTTEGIALAIQDVRTALQDNFNTHFITAGFPAFVADEATAVLAPALGALPLTGPLPSAGQLIQSPAQLVTTLFDLPGERMSLPQVDDLLAFDNTLPAVTQTTADRVQQEENQAALLRLVRGAVLTAAVASTATRDFESVTQAHAWRDALLQGIDLMAEDASGADIYYELAGLRARLVGDIAARSHNLARLSTLYPAQTEPALLAAYRLYGDAERDADLIARNHIRHPGFVPGGAPLEVLLDAT